jgi:hypothetical protein
VTHTAGTVWKDWWIQVCKQRDTRLGGARLVMFRRLDEQPMGYRELWEVFAGMFPDQYAVQVFPPKATLLDGANKYWLWVLDEPAIELDLVYQGGG